MESDTSKTPYNSIYEALNSKNPKLELVCCKHGVQCGYGKPAVKNEQYVNLPESEEQQVAEKLAAKLQNLAVQQETEKKPVIQEAPEKSKKKEKKGVSKDKRTKKKKAVIEENQAYEMLGPSTDESKSSAVIEKPPANKLGDAHKSYIGACTTGDAEVRVTQRGEFALYHLFESQSSLNNLNNGLPLMLVYYSTTKKHRHYPIRTCGTAADLQFYVDCGYPTVRKHYSLNQLIKYYKAFGTMQIPEDTFADAFTWWLE